MPYTAFTYGDPADISPNVAVVAQFLMYGDPGSSSDTVPVPWVSQIAGGTVGTAYSQAVSETGGSAPFTYAIQSGALPSGLSLSSAGLISGTPTSAGTTSFVVSVTDTNGIVGTQTFTIAIVTSSVTNYILIN